jgi:hypothetical protein
MVILDARTGGQIDSVPVGDLDLLYTNWITDRVIVGTSTGVLQCLHEVGVPYPIVHNVPDPEASKKPKVIQKTGDEPAAEEPADAEDDPFGGGAAGSDDDPFGGGAAGGDDDPFGGGAAGGDDDPFGGAGDAPAEDMPAGGDDDPFGGGAAGDDDDPFG